MALLDFLIKHIVQFTVMKIRMNIFPVILFQLKISDCETKSELKVYAYNHLKCRLIIYRLFNHL